MSESCPLVDPMGKPMGLVPTTAKVHDTILNFERGGPDNDDTDDVNMKYQVFKEILESVQDRIRHESQSRADTMNVLQKETEKATNDLLFKLHNEIFKRIDSTSVELRNALERATKLEASIDELKRETSMVFMNDLSLIQQQLTHLTNDFSDQCNISREIDESILARANQIDKSTAQLITVQYNEVKKAISTLENKIDKTVVRFKNNQSNLYNSIKHELQALTRALELATQARKDSDECIVQAIDEMMNLLPKELQLSDKEPQKYGEDTSNQNNDEDAC